MKKFTPCPDWSELLSAYQDDALAIDDRERVEEHLGACAACRQALTLLDEDRSRLEGAYAHATGGTALRNRVLEELRMENTPSSQITLPASWLRWLVGFTGVTALASLALISFLLVGNTRTPMTIVPVDGNGQVVLDSVDDSGKINAQTGIPHNVYNGLDAAERSRQYLAYDAPAKVPAMVYMNRRDLILPPERVSGFSGNLDTHGRSPVASPNASWEDALLGYVGSKKGFFHASDAFQNNSANATYDFRMNRNYGIPGGIQMAYDVDYAFLVKNALQGARKAQQIVREHGGFIIDFAFNSDEGTLPYASIRGKVPADQADKALSAIEKLGQVRGLTIDGEDLTEQFKQQIDEANKQKEHAEKLEKLENRSRPRVAKNIEQERLRAEQRAAAAKRALLGLQAKHELVEFSASFIEDKPRERLHFGQVYAMTVASLKLLGLVLVGVVLLLALIGIIASPWWLWKYLRRKE
ncbi:MAG: DUF4349 domain-containing protein [Armatimonadota bacterium]